MLARRRFLGRAAALALGGVVPGCVTTAGRARGPVNVLLVLADDLGWGDLSCYGRRDYTTPVLDALARDGVRLVNAYAASCVCSPTRAALLTGRYPQRLRPALVRPIGYRVGSPETKWLGGLSPELPTLASLLRARGYRTALVGKWHLGYPPHFGPLASGFDEFFGITSGGVDYFTHRDAAGHEDLYENDVTVQRAGYLTDLLSDRAVGVIERAARRREPFYLSLHYTAPHWPWMGPADQHRSARLGNFRDATDVSPAVYAAMVQSLDSGLGRVLAAVERGGLEPATLVIFTSDNGGERFSSLGPLSGRKEDLREGGIRVPALVRWPGVVPAGVVSSQVAITMDWTATILAATGTPADPRYPLDGETLLPALRDRPPPRPRVLHWRHRRTDAPQIQEAMLEGRLKYLVEDERELLFDLDRDESERVDLAGARPGDLARMRTQHEAWFARMTQ